MGCNITTNMDLQQYRFHWPYTYMIDTSTHFQLISDSLVSFSFNCIFETTNAVTS